MSYKINQVAKLVGISVRTLHHYDQIGLLEPESATPAGYRLYSDNELEKLQQILFFKELGFSLKKINDILNSSNFDKKSALNMHKELLIKQKERLEEIINTVEKTIQSIEGGTKMSEKEMFGAFDMSEIEKHQKKYADETRQKYGHTEAYKESQRRTSKYTKEDWAKISAKANEIDEKFIAAMDQGPESSLAQEAVSEWQQYISENFYTCSIEMIKGLGDLYVNDAKFTKNIDKKKPGLAKFKRDAMNIYCKRSHA
jgi:DNA-binding transcriptional MerR regulator